MLLAVLALAAGWRVPPPLGRRAFVAAVTGAASSALPLRPVSASGDKQYDKKYEACISQCTYEKLKIAKGVGQVEVMSRTDAFAACKPECREKLGRPKKN